MKSRQPADKWQGEAAVEEAVKKRKARDPRTVERSPQRVNITLKSQERVGRGETRHKFIKHRYVLLYNVAHTTFSPLTHPEYFCSSQIPVEKETVKIASVEEEIEMEGMRKNGTLCCTEKPLFFFSLSTVRKIGRDCKSCTGVSLTKSRRFFGSVGRTNFFSRMDGHPRPDEYYSHRVRKSEFFV